ncbi:hypothetical protein CWE09_01715 [Aliidiomarina minuta]|uniref:DUF4282 domain-containing protein n=1 Tax=Aliidiomarina minuta TaxID=880057 RepID=A0A432W5Y0_9GAMM|nr:hypothetical protein [Aliidiomarina minuta]RUO25480.1 hypothetical protein CWE09_01715 [Aliidiomarina minuta]
MSQIQSQIGPAVIQALILCIVRFFTIPWRIWKGAAYRLATMREHAGSETDKSTTTEFPVFDWFRAAWDGVIFLSWFVGALIAVITLLGGIFNLGLFSGIAAAIGVLVYSYFAVILMSFFKESLILLLSIALNVERLATAKNKPETE